MFIFCLLHNRVNWGYRWNSFPRSFSGLKYTCYTYANVTPMFKFWSWYYSSCCKHGFRQCGGSTTWHDWTIVRTDYPDCALRTAKSHKLKSRPRYICINAAGKISVSYFRIAICTLIAACDRSSFNIYLSLSADAGMRVNMTISSWD